MTRIICIALVVLAFLAFAPCLLNDFVNYDDPEYVLENEHVQAGLTWRGMAWSLTASRAANWHPLTWWSHMLDCQVYGLRPWGHHASSMVLHALNGVLLFLLLRRLTGGVWCSAFVAAVFAVHPLRVESVAWVSERKDVLSGTFWLLSIAAYARYVERPCLRRYALVALALALGLMAKPMLVTLPCVLLLLDWWPLKRLAPGGGAGGSSVGRLLVEKLPLLAVCALSAVVTVTAQRAGGALSSIESFPLPWRVANAALSYVVYLRQSAWPAGLAALYPHPGPALSTGWATAACAVLLGITVYAVRQARSRPYLAVGWLWYLGALVPVIGLVQVGGQAHADRYTYMPQVGLLIAVTWAAADLAGRWRVRRGALAAAAGTLLVLLASGTWRQCGYWRNSITLFTRALSCTSRNAVAHGNLGEALDRAGRSAEALEQFSKARAIDPRNPDVHYNWGNALLRMGRVGEAIERYETALTLQARQRDEIYSNLGTAFEREGDLVQAAECFRRALAINPGHAMTHFNLGVALAGQGKHAEAVAALEEAVRLDPADPDARFNLGVVLRATGQHARAVEQLRAALGLMETGGDPARETAIRKVLGSPPIGQGPGSLGQSPSQE